MPCCAVLECRNMSRHKNVANSGISYHRFPREPTIREKWIKATGRLNWMPSKTSTVCSIHFTQDNSISKKSGYRLLIPTAVPTINVFKFCGQVQEPDNAPSSPDCQNVDNDDSQSIVKRLITQRTRLLAALKLEKMKVKKFREQNRRKSIKIATLQNIIFDLKKKMLNMNAAEVLRHDDEE